MSTEKPFMNRRGFFKKLFGNKKISMSFFGIQVVWDFAGQEELRLKLQRVLDSPGSETPEEKLAFYKSFISRLLEAAPFFDTAFFEYIDDPEQAENSFEEWLGDIQASMATEEAETDEEIDGYNRMSREQNFVACTVLILYEGTHPFYEKNETTEEDFYTRAGICTLLESVLRYNFKRVLSDAAFILPGSPEDGFSSLDMADEGWSYLQPVRS